MRVARAIVAGMGALAWLFALSAVAGAAETRLTFSIKDARAFVEQVHYPQSTFLSERYFPCNPKTDPNKCDRTRYEHSPNCNPDEALGRTKEAPESPVPEDAEGGTVGDGGEKDTVPPDQPDPVRGNPVTVVTGLAMGRLSSTPESGGMASMYYVDNSGRREPDAHAESDGYVDNRATYEERCATVNVGESAGDGAVRAHVLSRSDDAPSTYNMAAYTTRDSARTPGGSHEGVSTVELWRDDERVFGLLSSTVRGVRLGDGALTVDVVRTVVYFSSDGTPHGLVARARTSASGVRRNGENAGALPQGRLFASEGYTFGLLAPRIKLSNEGKRLAIIAGGLYFAARTPAGRAAIPPEFGGRLQTNQETYIAGVLVDASLNRVASFSFGGAPSLEGEPDAPTLPTVLAGPNLRAPTIEAPGIAAPPPQQVAPPSAVRPQFAIRELDGSPWAGLALTTFAAVGVLAIGARWSLRYAWARRLSRYPPFAGIEWLWRAFVRD